MNKDATPTHSATVVATNPDLYATPPQMTNVLAENMVIYEDTPESHHDEFLPAMNMSSELLILRDIMKLTAMSPMK
jgi:hypothetical protein